MVAEQVVDRLDIFMHRNGVAHYNLGYSDTCVSDKP
jgi:hypothetical protein